MSTDKTSYKIIYTHTDEAPALATYSFLPVIEAYAGACGVPVESRDISLAARVLAAFNDKLPAEQRVVDALAELGELAKTPQANIIKLPNISASVPQLESTIAEFQARGYKLPNFPANPKTDDEKDARARYDRVKGSAVNPVLREGNSDRRAPKSVKAFAKKNPHSMGAWSKESKSHVATMGKDDFFSNEKSVTLSAAQNVRIEHVATDGTVTVLKDKTPVLAGEVIDGTFMSIRALNAFLEKEIDSAQAKGVLFSLHMKATMMKVSDPVIFGHAVKVFFAPLFEKHPTLLEDLGVNLNNGFGALTAAIATLDDDTRKELEADIQAIYATRPELAMVNSDKGITNLHVPSDVIIDASMPAMIRTSGQMWNRQGELQDTKAVIPDSSYAGVYDETFNFCRENGAFDPTTMGTVPNVGLMAQKAEEYGSHDKTFEVPSDGTVRVVDDSGKALMEHTVEAGDIWRMCQVKDAPVQDWVKLAVTRARAMGVPTIFWLDRARAHDAQLIKKVEVALKGLETDGLDIQIMSPVEATRFTLARLKQGKDTISVTGNVLRDYLTDLFPILELGTSAKMLSIVPLMNGGGLFETGAGGSAPKHVEQFEEENHLRWDSLGEFLALAVSLEHFGLATQNPGAKILGDALDEATGKVLENNKSPSRKVGELDNRGSHFYLSMYWAEELAAQDANADLKARFAPLAKALKDNEDKIVAELNGVQGKSVDVGGYYFPDPKKAAAAMRPSETWNTILKSL